MLGNMSLIFCLHACVCVCVCVCVSNLLCNMLHSAQACRIAVVVCDHHGRIKRLEVEHDDGILVEPRLGFHD